MYLKGGLVEDMAECTVDETVGGMEEGEVE